LIEVVTDKHCVCFEARNKYANIIYANFRLQRVRFDALINNNHKMYGNFRLEN